VLRKYVKSDRIAAERNEYLMERPDPSFVTHGPRTRREFLNLKAWGA
jgi:hypothetical protein